MAARRKDDEQEPDGLDAVLRRVEERAATETETDEDDEADAAPETPRSPGSAEAGVVPPATEPERAEESEQKPEQAEGGLDRDRTEDGRVTPAEDRDRAARRRTARAAERRQLRMSRQERGVAPAPPQLNVYTAEDDLPPAERNPMQRPGLTIGPIRPSEGVEFPDLAGRQPPANLTDLCQLYPIGNGMHYIRVERVAPKSFSGRPIAGLIAELRHPVSERQFVQQFGGGAYELVVYGPDPTGRMDPVSNTTIIKPLTKKIGVTYPGNPVVEADMDPGIPGYPGFTGRRPLAQPLGSAEANAFKASLDFAARMVTEERAEKRELQRNAAAAPAQSLGSLDPVLGVMRDQTKMVADVAGNEAERSRKAYELQIDHMRSEIETLRAELREQRSRPAESATVFSAVTDMVGKMAPAGRTTEEIARAHESHRDEMRRVTDQHRDEMKTREDQHRREIENIRATHDERMRILNEQVETERRRARDEVEQERRRYEDRERTLREQNDERLRTASERHTAELERLRSDHARELQSIERNAQLVAKTEKVGLETRIASLQEQLDRARAEAADKEDLEAQLAKTEHMAGLLGFRRDDGAPKDWKEHLAAAFSHAITNADKILDAGARTLAAAKAQPAALGAQQRPGMGMPQQAPPPQLQPRQRPPMHATRTWGVEGAAPIAIDHSRGRVAAPPPYENPPPQQQQPQPAPQPAPQQQFQPQPAPQPAGPAQNGAPVPQQAPPNGAAHGITGEDLDAFRIWAEQKCLQGAPPEVFAQELVGRIGMDATRQLLSAITAERFHEALSADPGMAQSPLVRRDGQRWIAAVFIAARQIVFTAPQAAPGAAAAPPG